MPTAKTITASPANSYLCIIGSMAANVWHPEIWTDPKDLDIIARMDAFTKWFNTLDDVTACYPIEDGKKFIVHRSNDIITEVEIAYPDSTAESFLKLVSGKTIANGLFCPDMNWLFTLKASHRYLKDSPHFEKTIRDYHLMRDMGCTIQEPEWFKQREEATYNKPRPSLNRTKDEFFVTDAGVNYIYDHDSIHEAMALGKEPAYKSYQADGAEVMPSKKKWDQCSRLTKLMGVLEETYVLALERSQITHGKNITPLTSFKIALSKVCTSITSGWFREFAYDNYFQVLDLYDDSYVTRFCEQMRAGVVKYHKDHQPKRFSAAYMLDL